VYEGNYISEIIIPSPRLIEKGESMELRMIDKDGNPYVIVFQGDSGGARYLRTNSSNYYIAKNDPWYRPPPTRGRLDVRPRHAAPADRALRREIKTKERIAQKLSDNIRENLRRRERVEQDMGPNPIMSQRVNHENLNDWIREDQARHDRIREDLDRMQAQLRDLREPRGSVEPTPNTIRDRQPFEPGHPPFIQEPVEHIIHRPQLPPHDESIAAQARSEILHRQAEERAEKHRQEQERLQEQQRQQREREREQREQREQIQRHNEQQERERKQNQDMLDQQRKINDKGLFS